ncbi:PilZ domain-containing protein [Paraglaciecola sp. L1A13]|uniref:PilZ domain-containing protein n=1 Tax=Paraglaciecola sp. L1A13 TaxID=2686359 RepID=UPI00131DFEDD|nr:PilZ domain-containing protein [Paraglaciecola sp. L1A13]
MADDNSSELYFMLLDVFVALVIILFFSQKRFNSWSEAPPDSFKGKPIDYISPKSFVAYFLLYALSIATLTLALYGIPGLSQLSFFKPVLEALGIKQESQGWTIFALISISVASVAPLEKYEKEWRKKLHGFARIPRDVVELRGSLPLTDRFIPTDYYLKIAKEQIIKSGEELTPRYKSVETTWLEHLNNFSEEHKNKTIHWHFLNSLLLCVVAKSVCPPRLLGPTDESERRMLELGSLILNLEINESHKFINELDRMAEYFEICICKSIVRKYSDESERFNALKNCGFQPNGRDAFKSKLLTSLGQCLVGVSFVSIFSVAMILMVLENSIDTDPANFFSDRFFLWSFGSFLSFSVAIMIAAVVAAQRKSDRSSSHLISIATCIALSTLAAALYFIIVSDLDARSESNPLARIVLALSFAMLSPVVYRAIIDNTFDSYEVKRLAFYNGFLLGGTLMVMQCAVSYTFNIQNISYSGLVDFFVAQNNKMIYLAIIGFFKGIILGTFVTFLIQHAKRAQYLKSLRIHPRASVQIPVNVASEGASAIAMDISKNGMKLETKGDLKAGDKLNFTFMRSDKTEGLVKWTKRKSRGRLVVGVLLSQQNETIVEYLRDKYGAYYV